MKKRICRSSRFLGVAVAALSVGVNAVTALGDDLPAGYTRLSFIKAYGNCHVKTGVTPASTDKVEMQFRPAVVNVTQNLWCSRDGSSGTSHQFTAFLMDSAMVRIDRNEGLAGQITGTGTLLAGKSYLLVADYAALTGVVTDVADNTDVASVTMASGDYTPGSELCLFGSHSSNPDTGYNNPASYRLYSFKLKDSAGDLRLDLVPAKRDADGVLGLYDLARSTFLTNCTSGTFLAEPAACVNSYVWSGGASGNLSDASNWTPAPAGAFTAADELVVNDAAEITVDAAATVGKITLNAAGAVAFAGANALTVTQIANAGAGGATFGCPVRFAGTYYVEKNGAVKFPGGATATYPDNLLRTASVPDRTLDGDFTFTSDWIVNDVGDYPWIVPDGSTLHGQNFTGSQVSHGRILRVDAGGYARFANVTNGWDLGDIDIDGTLEVVNEMIVRTRPTSSSSLSHFGREGNTGTVKAWRIAKSEHAIAQSFIPNLVVGAGGMGSLTQDYYWRFEVDTTITASDDFEFLGLPNGADWGIGVLSGKTLTIDTAGHTVTCGIGVQGAGALAKAGAGTLVMTNGCNGATGAVKEYSGGTAVNGGTLRVAADNSIGPGPVTVAEGARLEIADGLALSSKVEGEGTLALAGDLTLADGGRLFIDACTFAEGAEVFVAKQSEYGVVASNVTQTAYETHFTSAAGELSWADGTVSYNNGFVWAGAAGGMWSDPANWLFNGVAGKRAPLDDAYADVSIPAPATVVLDVPATIRTLSFSGTGAVQIANPAAAHGFVSTNRLTVASVSNSASVIPEIDCKVYFTETYKVDFTGTTVHFAGGATATNIDSGNALTSPTAILYGNFTLTQGWTIPTAPSATATIYTHTLRSGSTLTAPTMTLIHKDMGAVGRTTQLSIEAGATANVGTVYHQCGNDTWNNCRHAISVHCNGTLNVKTMYSLNGDYAGGRIGMHKHKGSNSFSGTGTFNLQGIECVATKQTGWHTWLEQFKTNIGASGIRVASGFNTKAFGFAHGMTVGALADYTIRSERATPSMGLYGNTTFDTLDSADRTTPRTITITANLTDLAQTHGNAQYPGIGQIIKVNPGRLVLSGDSTYSNGTKINGGTVRLEHNNAAGTGPITVAAGATLELADGVTIANAVTFADGATLVCGTGSQISGTVTRNGTVNLHLLGTTTIFPSGYTDTTGFVVSPDSAVGTLSVDGGALKYDARAVGTYTWTGAVDGNFSTPGNWSVNGEATTDVPDVQDTIRFAPEEATTVTLDADATVTAMVIEGEGALTIANPGATTNTLTLASVTSSATVMPVINCKVQFTGKYTVSFTNTSVDFAGGATATTWNGANSAVAPTAEFRGNITFTEDWSVPNANGNRLFIRSGATVTCQTLILPYRGGSYLTLSLLQIDAGGTLNCRRVQQKGSTYYYNGVGEGVTVYVNGRLNVAEDYEVLRSGRIGINKVGGAIEYYGNGLFCVEGMTIDQTVNEWLSFEQKKAAFGAGGIVIKATDKYAHSLVIAPWVTFGTLADYAITSEKTEPKMGLYGDLTFDTQNATNAAVSHTVLVAVNLYDKAKDHQYQYGYPGKGSIIKKNAGTLILAGDNRYSNGTSIQGGTLLAAHDHALGAGAAAVAAGGTLEIMEGVSVTNAVTLAADATLLIDGVEARAAAYSVGTISAPASGTANLKVAGDFSGQTDNVSIPVGVLASGSTDAAFTLDATALTLPTSGWKARLKARDGALVLDVKKAVGMTIFVR